MQNQLAEAPVKATADATQQNKQRHGREQAETSAEIKNVSEIEQFLVQKTFTK